MSSTSTSPIFRCPRLLVWIAGLSIIAVLGGCGEQKKAATQVAAKVGADDITVNQVNNILAKMQPVPGKSPDQVKHEVLENLIDQQLAIQQAIDKKLDREPAVMEAMEEAKRDILARAYMDRIRSATPVPSTEEISKYYAEHPELFANRHVFNLRELGVPAQAGLADSLRDQINKGVTLEAIAASLKSKNIALSVKTSTHAAEEMPFEILSKVSALKDGQMTLIEGKNAISILQVVSSQSAPVDETAASAPIRQYLLNKRSNEEIMKELKSLRQSAKIEYLGDFVATAAATPAATEHVAADTSSKVTEHPSAPDVAKGVANLK
jgi:EpsD family peptidyl-prolyl cis-trans isomerase